MEIKQLFINENVPRSVLVNGRKITNFYKASTLVWKGSNSFIFTSDLADADITKLSPGTLVFENFSPTTFTGDYSTVDSVDNKPKEEGQMIVVNTTEEDD